MNPEEIIWKKYGHRIANGFEGFDVILKDDLEEIIKEAIELHKDSHRLSCDDVDRLRKALSFMGHSTPESLEEACSKDISLVRRLINAVLESKIKWNALHDKNIRIADKIKVFEKGCFYDPETDSDLPERELKDTDGWEVVVNRRGEVIVVEHGMHDQKFFHVIENDNDDKYRVERVFPEAK